MKQIVLFFFMFFLSFALYSQTYHALTDDSNKWNYLDAKLPTCCAEIEFKTFALFLNGDTLIGDVSYKKLMATIIRQNETKTVFAAALREDIAKQAVYARAEDKEEELIYSFSHQAGDTISIDTATWGDTYTIRYAKTVEPYDFNGFTGKRITISDTLYRVVKDPRMSPYESFSDVWYEGIGSMKRLLDLTHIGEFGISMEMLCFWNNNLQLYQNPRWPACEYALIDQADQVDSAPTVDLFPNPTGGLLEVRSAAPLQQVTVMNMNGCVVLKQNSRQIDMTGYPGGIYLLRIETSGNVPVSRMIIKR